MASSKDVFEARLFGASLFAAGAFRGVGVAPSAPLAFALEYSARLSRPQWNASGQPAFDWTARDGRVHFTASMER